MKRNATGTKAAIDPAIRFGNVPLTDAGEAFRHAMNQVMINFIQSLPTPMHTDAIIFFKQHFKVPFFPEVDFLCNYYVPAWSILYWIEQEAYLKGSITQEGYHKAKVVHAMALFLHPLDDHLNDGQLATSHLTLLLRSQAWALMTNALNRLADGIEEEAIVSGFINEYYASIGAPPEINTLDGYCTHFQKQMATGMIAPTLLALKLSADKTFCETLQQAYGAFGIAWRLLDDLQDMESDWLNGSRSAVYYCMDVHLRNEWDLAVDKNPGRLTDSADDILYMSGVQATITARILQELEKAANLVTQLGMRGLASELFSLGQPLKDRQEPI